MNLDLATVMGINMVSRIQWVFHASHYADHLKGLSADKYFLPYGTFVFLKQPFHNVGPYDADALSVRYIIVSEFSPVRHRHINGLEKAGFDSHDPAAAYFHVVMTKRHITPYSGACPAHARQFSDVFNILGEILTMMPFRGPVVVPGRLYDRRTAQYFEVLTRSVSTESPTVRTVTNPANPNEIPRRTPLYPPFVPINLSERNAYQIRA